MSTKARQFLEQKLRETIAECNVPALAAALVRDAGNTTISAQQGVRKLGASGAANAIQPTDRFNLGSISKVLTGNLMGKLIQEGVGTLQWNTRLVDVLPELWTIVPGVALEGYKNVTIEQFLTHTSGMKKVPDHDDELEWINYTPLDMTKAKLKVRRQKYTLAATADAPIYWPPGSGSDYSGGGIIASCMAEKRTDQTYEDLIKQHLFTPLGMTNSGSGVLSSGELTGTWQHTFDPETRTAAPDANTHKPGYNWYCRASVGSMCSTAADLAKFMREQLRADPQVFSTATRSTMQTHQVSTHSSYVRGAWASSQPGSPSATIEHNGDNGVSYSNMKLHLGQQWGVLAMSNISSQLSFSAVNEMHEAMGSMHHHWSELFGAGSPALVECVHPVPAVTLAGTTMMMFARRHDGRVFRSRSTNSGSSWQSTGDFGAVVVNSGLGAAASSDGQRIYVMGRGTDNKAWFGWSTNGGTTWQGWNPIRAGVFSTGPAVACSANGLIVHAVGIGTDARMWRTRSTDGGAGWVDWTPIGQGVFTSAPAIATSADGKIVHVVARGTDWRAWHNVSMDGGASFKPHWAPIGNGIFSAGIGIAVSDSGQRVHVMGRGTDRVMWRNTSANAGSSWLAHWEVVPNGTFTSAPYLATNASGLELVAYAFGSDFHVWGNRSTDSGQNWSGWGQKSKDFFL